MSAEHTKGPNHNEATLHESDLSGLFGHDHSKEKQGRRALAQWLDAPMKLLERPAPHIHLTDFHRELTKTYTPVVGFVTTLMERIQYGDKNALNTLTQFSNWYESAGNHTYRSIQGQTSMQTVAHIAGCKSDDRAIADDLFSLSEFPTFVRAYIKLISANPGTYPGVDVFEASQALIGRQYANAKGVIGKKFGDMKSMPKAFTPKPVLSLAIVEMARELVDRTKGSGTWLTSYGVSGGPLTQKMSHMLGYYLVQKSRHDTKQKQAYDPNHEAQYVECLPIGESVFAVYGYQGETNRQLSVQLAPQGIKSILDKIDDVDRLTPKGVASCIKISFGELPSDYTEKIRHLQQGIISATRALHSRGHVDNFHKAPNTALRRIGVESLTFRQTGQTFEIDISYHGSALSLQVNEEGFVQFPADIHDPQAKAKIELMVLAHLGEILNIHRKPRAEPSRARGGGKPVPYRGRHLQIQPLGKGTTQLDSAKVNASIQDWLKLPEADITWINLAFNIAQEAEHLALAPIDDFIPFLVNQGVNPTIALKVKDLMQRLKDRELWPPVAGEDWKARAVSFVDEIKEIPGVGPLDTNTSPAQKHYHEMLPPAPTPSPMEGTVFSSP